MEWLCNSVLVTEQIKEKEASKDILNRPLPASRDLPLARVGGVETRGTGMTFQGFVHGSQQRLCSWTWRASEAEYDWPSFIVLLLSLTPPTPPHTHIKEKEREANLRRNRDIFNHVKPKEQHQRSLKNWNCALDWETTWVGDQPVSSLTHQDGTVWKGIWGHQIRRNIYEQLAVQNKNTGDDWTEADS